jgi:hypothetical protein
MQARWTQRCGTARVCLACFHLLRTSGRNSHAAAVCPDHPNVHVAVRRYSKKPYTRSLLQAEPAGTKRPYSSSGGAYSKHGGSSGNGGNDNGDDMEEGEGGDDGDEEVSVWPPCWFAVGLCDPMLWLLLNWICTAVCVRPRYSILPSRHTFLDSTSEALPA